VQVSEKDSRWKLEPVCTSSREKLSVPRMESDVAAPVDFAVPAELYQSLCIE